MSKLINVMKIMSLAVVTTCSTVPAHAFEVSDMNNQGDMT